MSTRSSRIRHWEKKEAEEWKCGWAPRRCGMGRRNEVFGVSGLLKERSQKSWLLVQGLVGAASVGQR